MEYVKQLYSASNSMLVVISDILDFSKIEAGTISIEPADYNVEEVINGIVNVTSMGLKDKPVVMKLSIAPDIPKFLHGDNFRLGQVLTNIISNAVKFTKEGSISISVDHEKIDDNNINLKIWVTDTGIGIRQEDYERIFESFSQVNSRRDREVEGTGLGLAISQRLIRLMNGNIEVESEYGVGSTFKIYLPQGIGYSDGFGKYVKTDKADKTKKLRAPAARILVVDDNSVNLYVARNLLGLYDIKPTCVLSGEMAIKAVEKHDFDLILMDYMMPKMDGIEATHRIREQYPAYKDIPIIAFTANAVEEARELLLKEGMDDFISKPVKGTELEALLLKWLPENMWDKGA
jgi:CheY-like chemotaxis protein